MTATILVGDCREVLAGLPDNIIHCVVTSPPYWGLRDYGVDGQFGLENSISSYLDQMVQVFREVRRVMRPDATLWLNMGDCYAATANGRSAKDTKALGRDDRTFRDKPFNTVVDGLKPKDLVGMPWRLAFALQADGWWLRQDIVWAKPNPMPESVTDRCTKSHEYLFLMTKGPRYFFDAEAIKEPVTGKAHSRGHGLNPKSANGGYKVRANKSFQVAINHLVSTRHKRSVWTVSTKPFKEAHFATFPPDLIEPCIKAGTSKHGCCSACGTPYQRLQRRIGPDGAEVVLAAGVRFSNLIGDNRFDAADQSNRHSTTTMPLGTRASFNASQGVIQRVDIGWVPTCKCSADVMPCVVLDPFGGAGTTSLVADNLGRDSILIELNPEYADLAYRRIKAANPFFAVVEMRGAA